MKTRPFDQPLFDVEAVLAADEYGVIGQADSLPWHHSGDFKRFKSLTMGQNIIMGMATYLGLARRFTKPGKPVLPGRNLFVVGRAVKEDLDVDLCNFTRIDVNDPVANLKYCLSNSLPGTKLFVCGGSRIFRDYLDYAETVHFTLIRTRSQRNLETSSLHPKNMDLLGYNGINEAWRVISFEGSETNENGLAASYFRMTVN